MNDNATTTRRPLNFATRDAAAAWLKATNNYGAFHESCRGGFIVIQFHEGAVWAFTAPDEMALLPEW